MTSTITIYHNPACGTSRNVLGLIRNSGVEPTVIHYLETPPDRAQLERLIADGLVVEQPDGRFLTMPPKEAAQHIDRKWDLFLDELPEPVSAEGMEFVGGEPPLAPPTT